MSVHEELLALHTLLLCPAECPPIQDGDTHTVRLLKGLIDNWHTLATTEETLRAALERIAKYPRVRGDELGYDGCRQVARDALKTANALAQGPGGSSPGPAGAMGSAAHYEERK